MKKKNEDPFFGVMCYEYYERKNRRHEELVKEHVRKLQVEIARTG